MPLFYFSGDKGEDNGAYEPGDAPAADFDVSSVTA
jgi:hypothetical protein